MTDACLGLIISLVIIGLIAGSLARLAVPGKQDLTIRGTVVLGIVGSFVGGFLGYLLFHHRSNQRVHPAVRHRRVGHRIDHRAVAVAQVWRQVPPLGQSPLQSTADPLPSLGRRLGCSRHDGRQASRVPSRESPTSSAVFRRSTGQSRATSQRLTTLTWRSAGARCSACSGLTARARRALVRQLIGLLRSRRRAHRVVRP